MGSTICTAGFPSAAIASSCFTARCDSIWYGFFIATLLFSAKENSLSAYQGWERGVATFYDLPGIPGRRAPYFENHGLRSANSGEWKLGRANQFLLNVHT